MHSWRTPGQGLLAPISFKTNSKYCSCEKRMQRLFEQHQHVSCSYFLLSTACATSYARHYRLISLLTPFYNVWLFQIVQIDVMTSVLLLYCNVTTNCGLRVADKKEDKRTGDRHRSRCARYELRVNHLQMMYRIPGIAYIGK